MFVIGFVRVVVEDKVWKTDLSPLAQDVIVPDQRFIGPVLTLVNRHSLSKEKKALIVNNVPSSTAAVLKNCGSVCVKGNTVGFGDASKFHIANQIPQIAIPREFIEKSIISRKRKNPENSSLEKLRLYLKQYEEGIVYFNNSHLKRLGLSYSQRSSCP